MSSSMQDALAGIPPMGFNLSPGWVGSRGKGNSFHHQLSRSPPRGITAKSQTGLLRLSMISPVALRVQWHPELMVEYYPEH